MLRNFKLKVYASLNILTWTFWQVWVAPLFVQLARLSLLFCWLLEVALCGICLLPGAQMSRIQFPVNLIEFLLSIWKEFLELETQSQVSHSYKYHLMWKLTCFRTFPALPIMYANSKNMFYNFFWVIWTLKACQWSLLFFIVLFLFCFL